MALYSKQDRKFQQFFNDIKNAKTNLDNKRNEELVLNFFKTTIKPYFILEDTGWLSKAPEFPTINFNNIKTIYKGDLLPELLVVDYSKELEIPESVLPYIDLKMLVAPVPESQLTTFVPFTTTEYINNYVSVKGDGSNIYTGAYPGSITTSLISDVIISDSSLGTVAPPANTKKVWFVDVEYNLFGATPVYINNGELRGVVTYENLESCDSNDIYDTFDCLAVPIDTTYPFYSKITAFDENGFTGTGRYIERNFTTGSPTCDFEEIETPNTTLSKSFGAVDKYILYVFGSIFRVSDDAFLGTFTVGIESDDLTSLSNIQYAGNRVYYSNLTQRNLQFSVSGTDILLTNYPTNIAPEVRPYTNLTLERNLEPLSATLSTSTTSDIALESDTALEGLQSKYIRKEIALFKIPDTENNYFLKAKLNTMLLSPAILEDPNPTIQTQNDSYSQSGSSYTRTSNVDGLVSEAYIPAGNDVQYRIFLIVKNPFYYQEVRKYDTTQ